MKWDEIAGYLKFPFRCSCGETAHSATEAFEHYYRGHILHVCPVCSGRLYIPDVKGEYGARDVSKYGCYGCGREFDKDAIRRNAIAAARGQDG